MQAIFRPAYVFTLQQHYSRVNCEDKGGIPPYFYSNSLSDCDPLILYRQLCVYICVYRTSARREIKELVGVHVRVFIRSGTEVCSVCC